MKLLITKEWCRKWIKIEEECGSDCSVGTNEDLIHFMQQLRKEETPPTNIKETPND
jgi:hypothetical protein